LRQLFKWDTVQKNGSTVSGTKKRSTHPQEFEAKVGLEAVRGAKTVKQIAQELGVQPVANGDKREFSREFKLEAAKMDKDQP